jgi:hypothetical protein
MGDSVWDKLKAPFPADAIEWRVGRAGKSGDRAWVAALAYITSRHVMDRLDQVVGPLNWKDTYQEISGGFVCALSLREDKGGEWITRCDGADKSDIEPIKGGISDALKRAAVKFGIGRYLYDLTETFATEVVTQKPQNRDGWNYHKGKDFECWWKPPALPKWALPGPTVSHEAPQPPPEKPAPPPAETPKPASPTKVLTDMLGEIAVLIKPPRDDVERSDRVDAIIRYLSDDVLTLEQWKASPQKQSERILRLVKERLAEMSQEDLLRNSVKAWDARLERENGKVPSEW